MKNFLEKITEKKEIENEDYEKENLETVILSKEIENFKKIETDSFEFLKKESECLVEIRDSETVLNVIDLTRFIKGDSKDWIDPPYDPFLWSLRFEYNTRFKTGIRKKIKSLFSNGFRIEIIDEELLNKSEKKKAETQKKILESFLKSPNPEDKKETINSILSKIYIDKAVTGTGYLEAIRNKLGRLSSLNHIRAVNTRKRKKDKNDRIDTGYIFFDFFNNRKNFLKIRETSSLFSSKYFLKSFGDRRGLNKETGDFYKEPNYLKKNESSEVIVFKDYAPGVEHYGIPDAVSAKFAIDGNLLVSIQNLTFLKNNSTPRLIFVVKNGSLNAKDIGRLEYFLNVSGAGPENAGKALILQPATKHQGLPNAHVKEADIKIEKVGIASIEDAAYTRYRKDNNSEIAEAIEVPELFFNAESGGKAAAATIEKFFIDKIIQPEANEFETMINLTIVEDLLSTNKVVNLDKMIESEGILFDEALNKSIELNSELNFNKIDQNNGNTVAIFKNKIYVRFKLILPTTKDELIEARVYRLLQDLNVMTPNDINKAMGKKIIDEPWANRPSKIIEMALNNGADRELLLGSFGFKEEDSSDFQDDSENSDKNSQENQNGNKNSE